MTVHDSCSVWSTLYYLCYKVPGKQVLRLMIMLRLLHLMFLSVELTHLQQREHGTCLRFFVAAFLLLCVLYLHTVINDSLLLI